MEDASGELYVFSSKGMPFGGPKHDDISDLELNKVHIFVLNNTDDEEIEEHIRNHKLKLEAECSANIDQRHETEFPAWFRQQVLKSSSLMRREIRSLALGLDRPVDEIIQEEEPGFVLCVDLGEIPQLVRDVPSLNSIDATIVNAATAETCIENDYDDEFIDDEDCDVDCGDQALANGFVENEGLWTDDDEYVDDDSPGKGRKPLVKKRRLESLWLRDSISSQGQKSAQGMSTSTTEHNVSTSVSPFHLRDENDEGPDSQSFINESSAVAHKFGKHNVPKWSQLEKEDREAMCQRVMMKKAVEQQVNKSYRNRRHKHSWLFKTFKSKEEALRQVPDEFPKEEWIYLCNYFTSKKFKGQMRDLESAGYEPKEICIATVGKLPGSAGHALTKSYYVEEVCREKERADVAEKERKETDAKLEKMAVEQETLRKTLVAENEVLKESLAVLLERVNRMEAQHNA
ncbi:OLC1v1007878C1 [Oldenlandia corymbosa var. corymbosa]|uniref:OLC1v1007878C1 n=1 Tax=Oldenlandia corymbosa var. corymbosa TaxID=529605 RepID=A0AAV1DKP5_OLDCO|nr:OLC1v1007878C1 [Oldenlandia corymbosa var. corymbosa]